MSIMYRVTNGRNEPIGYFPDYHDANDFLKELGLGDDGRIDEIELEAMSMRVLKQNVKVKTWGTPMNEK